MQRPHKIGVVGIGMVGKPIVDYFLEKGYQRRENLFCFDKNLEKGYSDDVSRADVIFVCVPTPSNSDGSCDTTIVESVIKEFSNEKNKDKVFVIKSTIEPGTTRKLQEKYNCNILFNPEFLTEVRAKEDFLNPDRQIVAHTIETANFAEEILKLLPKAKFASPNPYSNPHPVKINSSEAEIGKYGANVFGAMKVSFGNILADFCSALEKDFAKRGIKTKVDYNNAKQVIANDQRIGSTWLDVYYANYRGFAGYCFPKDLNAFITLGRGLEEKLDKKDKDKELISKGLVFLEAMRDYNIALLKSQNIDLKEISIHNHEVEAKLKDKDKNAKKE